MKQKTKSTEKYVWVELEVNKYTKGISVFRGQILQSDLEAWAAGGLVEGAIKLEKTYWLLGEGVCVLGKGEDKHYTGDIYLRVDTIMLIYTLKENSSPNDMRGIDNIFHFPGRSKPAEGEHV